MKKLLSEMRSRFEILKQTRLEMLKSFVFKTAAQQLEPVEGLAYQQMLFNESVANEIEILKQEIKQLKGV
ncbi:hypothetical protein VFES401_13945 [Aliivibrio fischeri]|uniref:hypothetical protein n=1 Tax=Aliivibrio fischeri TaxID=668 RepID=UPI000A7605B0|nr:hypothetical protein [Aliivibrio fischeri]TGA68008.1 hypothetical protein VFES401_13945 [Aliivibrio fischeri]